MVSKPDRHDVADENGIAVSLPGSDWRSSKTRNQNVTTAYPDGGDILSYHCDQGFTGVDRRNY